MVTYEAGSYVRSRSLHQSLDDEQGKWYVVERQGQLITEVFGPLEAADLFYIRHDPQMMWTFGHDDILQGDTPQVWRFAELVTKEAEE